MASPNDSNVLFVFKKTALKTRNIVTKIWDPEIVVEIEGRRIITHLSHRFPNFFTEWPLYDRALPRLASFIKERFKSLHMIDVGANVGETLNLIYAKVQGSFLCIEPSKKYFKLLVKNTQGISNVVLENIALGESTRSEASRIVEWGGTAYLQKTTEQSMEILTLDQLIESKHREFSNVNLIKIDTDGYDHKVIQGARNILSLSKPIVFFELAPSGHISTLGDDPFAVFPLLNELGYEHFLFYDNYGFIITPVHSAQTNIIKGLIDYAYNKWNIWLDVAAFNDAIRDCFFEFYDRERMNISVLAKSLSHKRRL